MNPFVKLAMQTGKHSSSTAVADAIQQISRRDFLKTGGVFVIGVSLFGCGGESVRHPPSRGHPTCT